jgi:hypothetical protein
MMNAIITSWKSIGNYGECHTSSWKSARKLWGIPYIIMEICKKIMGNSIHHHGNL